MSVYEMESSRLGRRLALNWGLFFCLLAAVLLMSPMLGSGYYEDDALNSLIPGILERENKSVWRLYAEFVRGSVEAGRFTPLGWYFFLIFAVWPSVLVYKLSIMGMVLICVGMAYKFVHLVTNASRPALLSAFLVPLCFQFRAYHDPILSYNWLAQLILILNVGALIALVRYLQASGFWRYLLSLALFLASLLTYEVSYPFFLLHWWAILRFGQGSRLKAMISFGAPYLLLVLACATVTSVARVLFQVPLSGSAQAGAYTPHLDVVAVAETVVRQLFAVLPLSYTWTDPHHLFTAGPLSALHPALLLGTVLLLALGAFVSLRRSRQISESPSNQTLLTLLGFGLLLYVLPTLMIALSPRYQRELVWGIGYIPGFIASFGFVMLLSAFAHWMEWNMSPMSRWGAAVRAGGAGLFAMVGTVTLVSNVRVVDHYNGWFHFKRDLIGQACEVGLLEHVPGIQALLTDSDGCPWDKPTFYLMHARRNLSAVGRKGGYTDDPQMASLLALDPKRPEELQQVRLAGKAAYLTYDATSTRDGYAAVGVVSEALMSARLVERVGVERASLFVRAPGFGAVTVRSRPFRSDVAETLMTRPIASGRHWRLYDVSWPGGKFDLKSLTVSLDRSADGQ